MKIRNGFVSNSSSSSFIIKCEEALAKMKEHRINVHKISEVIEKFEPLITKLKEAEVLKAELAEIMPGSEMYWETLGDSVIDEYNDLLGAEEANPGAYFTDAVDRDWAYTNGIDYEVFEGDL